jgi:glycerate dehydrogenase
MKIVVLDGFTLNPGDLSWDAFKALGDFVCHDRTPAEKIVERIGNAEAVITNKTPITSATLDACPGIRYIGVLATGYNVVDVEAAKARNIPVTNIPAYSTPAVAQFVFALLLEICHHVAHHAETVREGRWCRSVDFAYWDYPLIELADKTLGIIGFGRIGQAVARIGLALGMQVLAFSPHPNPELENASLHYCDLDSLLSQSDVISLHVPLFDSTRGLINAAALDKMKDGVIVINTSRGPVVVEADMALALASGKVSGYGADVVSVEPIREDNPLLLAQNCFITPHIAWAPQAARLRLMRIAADNLAGFLQGKPVNVVNGK